MEEEKESGTTAIGQQFLPFPKERVCDSYLDTLGAQVVVFLM